MKYIFLCLIGGLAAACNVPEPKEPKAQDPAIASASFENKAQEVLGDSAQRTTIQWIDPEVQNLGSIKKGQIAEITWKFKNTGSKPLYISNVRAGCGCTTPDVPKEPIAPGQQSVIKAKFNSENFSGHVRKEVYVQANNSNPNNGTHNKLSFTADIK
jgi:hypothetical protein